jgi:hypothetical protein
MRRARNVACTEEKIKAFRCCVAKARRRILEANWTVILNLLTYLLHGAESFLRS